MHKIQRNAPPDKLEEKNIEFNKRNDYTSKEIENAWKSFSTSKLKKETVEQLEKMFAGCCAYCEGEYTGTSYPHIDHFKPKSLYPSLMFDYSNMNLSCEVCNKEKRDIDDIRLINPTVDAPEEHLKNAQR